MRREPPLRHACQTAEGAGQATGEAGKVVGRRAVGHELVTRGRLNLVVAASNDFDAVKAPLLA